MRSFLSSSTGLPVVFSAVRTSSMEVSGRAERKMAHAPATWGAAIEVPILLLYPSPGTVETIDSPGASRSRNVAELEKEETESTLVSTEEASVVDPTLTTEERQEGKPILFVWS
jgi:hypothetical protein